MKVSIGICAHNEEKNIGRLLDRLLSEKFKFRKIIVVASGCIDRTVEIVREFKKKSKKMDLVVEKERKGKASAVDLILKRARGDVILFICADNLPKRGSLGKLLEPLLDPSICATSGRPVPLESKTTLFGFISHLIWELHHEVCLVQPKLSGEFFAIRRKVIKTIPKTIINDDGYFTALLRKRGCKIAYVPNAITYMTDKNSLRKHIKRRRRIARGYTQLKPILDISMSRKLIFKLVLKRIREEPWNFHKIIFAVLLEILTNFLALYDTLRGYTPYCWER